MAKPPYDIGDQVTLQATFTLANGTLANPGTVVCRVRQPDGTLQTVTPVSNPSTGVFQAVFAPAQSGEHWYRFEGTGGSAVGADEAAFIVDPKKVQ